MRLVIDLQGAQGASRNRGIGRYSLSLARAIIENKGEHRVIIALNGNFPESIDAIRDEFSELLPKEDVKVWYVHGPCCNLYSENDWRRQVAENSREAFLASLDPDIVLVTSLFEGLDNDAVTSIGKFDSRILTAVILYDLIPFLRRHEYMAVFPIARFYESKLDHMRRADLLLSISESSRCEALQYLKFPQESVINISTAADSRFKPISLTDDVISLLQEKYRLKKNYVMTTAGSDKRKNVEGLIRAYSALPYEIRGKTQLLIVGLTNSDDRNRHRKIGKKLGLSSDELIIVGYVSERDLLSLYNGCGIFIFPSMHEGFGLPVLEAMSCGKAVIGSNSSSIPEVIGHDDALFDPSSESSITEKLLHVLTDHDFRKELEKHSLQRAKKFSWKNTAQRALKALEEKIEVNEQEKRQQTVMRHRPKMAYFSPLPPERSGISDYSMELLPELSRFYDIDIITENNSISDIWILSNCHIRTIDWFRHNAARYDRVLYHFGNSLYHQAMVEILNEISGVVVLHDFFLFGLRKHMEVSGVKPDAWTKALYYDHGYNALSQKFDNENTVDIEWSLPCNLEVINEALGIISHSQFSKTLANEWYNAKYLSDWEIIPLLRKPALKVDRNNSRESLNLNKDEFIVCSFGMLYPTKLNHRLLECWLSSNLSRNKSCRLIFVGENHGGDYGENLKNRIQENNMNDQIIITGWVDSSTFKDYLASADVAVQLRTMSRGETSAAALDCMNYGIPTIVNANGSLAEYPDDVVLKLNDEFNDIDLIGALEKLWSDKGYTKLLGKRAQLYVHEYHNTHRCAEQYYNTIECFYNNVEKHVDELIDSVVDIDIGPDDSGEWIDVADVISRSLFPRICLKQILVDVSELVQRDSGTGIQRVVRSILHEWLHNPPKGVRIEPVYATTEHSYRYARQFTMNFLQYPTDIFEDEPVTVRSGDIFVGLDLQMEIVPAQRSFFQNLRRDGVSVYFVVYDLLCILQPHNFRDGAEQLFQPWLNVVAESDGAICISKSVAKELRKWLDENKLTGNRLFDISWFHLGADIQYSAQLQESPENHDELINTINERHTFLVVGTIEPRKHHAQILSAFEELWRDGHDVNLVFVGGQGWLVQSLIEIINHHSELENHFFWFESVSDSFLEKVYSASDCLISASEGEGFGLPLIEAAKHNMYIIARDIPVFREIAGGHAYFFNGLNHTDIKTAVIEYFELLKKCKMPTSEGMNWQTWKDSAEQLMKSIQTV